MMNNVLENALAINLQKYASVIRNFLKEKVSELKRDGIVVPISGGLDSSVVATFCVNAVGRKQVVGLILPEKEGNPDAETYAYILARHLGFDSGKIDRILAGIEQDIPEKEISEITGIPAEEVQKITSLYHLTHHMRNPSMAPRFT